MITPFLLSFPPLKPPIHPSLIVFKFIASFLINYCYTPLRIHICICIPKYGLLCLENGLCLCVVRTPFAPSALRKTIPPSYVILTRQGLHLLFFYAYWYFCAFILHFCFTEYTLFYFRLLLVFKS